MESRNKITTVGWAGISLIAAGFFLCLYGLALTDFTLPRAWDWWGVGFSLFRIGGFAVFAGIATALVGNWFRLEVKPQRKLEVAQEV